MFDYFVSLAQNPVTPLVVLTCAITLVLVECWKASPKALMGDMFADNFDE